MFAYLVEAYIAAPHDPSTFPKSNPEGGVAWAMRKLTIVLHNSSATTKKGGENLVLDGEPLLLEETLAQHWPAALPLVQIKCVKAHHSFVHTGWSQGPRFPGYKQVVLREGRVLKRKQAWIMNQILHVAQKLLVGWGALPLIPPIISRLIPSSMRRPVL